MGGGSSRRGTLRTSGLLASIEEFSFKKLSNVEAFDSYLQIKITRPVRQEQVQAGAQGQEAEGALQRPVVGDLHQKN